MNPSWTCGVCGRRIVIQLPARSPDAAKRKLVRACKTNGHDAIPEYLCGIA